ncbi:MFS transporter [Duganella aceris]|uniref:TCR/Tet family MFS transporter n=1 Tax=Duganella aceris TaxID=2703883 RepID=A0ABX0FJY2_9BURK|nr:MFS transporter [Duganella aceris]NGZ84845.1 TCR/Tet family MFS transporter [Duganella aceris]
MRRIRVLFISVFLNFAGFTLIIPVLPFSVGRYVAAPDVAFWMSAILAVYALCSFVAAPVLGAMSDRFGRRPVLLLSLCGSALGFAVFGVGGALWVLVLGRVLEGLTAGSISALYAYVADTHAPAERGPAFGMLGVAGGLGFMLGPVLGGLLGQMSLAAPLYGAAGLALLNALLVYLHLPESHSAESRSGGLRWGQFNAIGQLGAALRDRRLRLLFAVVFCFAFGSVVLQSNLAVLLKERLSFNPAAIGLVLAGIGVMDIVSQGLVATRLLPRFGERRVAGSGLLINGLGLVLLALLAIFPVLPLLVCGIAMFTFGDGLFQPSVSALIADAAPVGRQGEVQGANQAQQSIARMFGPLASAWLYGLFAGAPYAAAAIVVFLAAGTLLMLRPPAPSRPGSTGDHQCPQNPGHT